MRFRFPLILGLLLVILGAGLAPRPLEAVSRRPVLIVLREQADLRGAQGKLKKQARGREVVEQLRRRAERDQPQIMALLKARGIEGRGLLSLNAIAAEVDEQTLRLLLRHPAVSQVLDNGPRQVLEPLPGQSPAAPAAPAAPNGVTWGVAHINADDVWSTYGVTGTGIVVAGNDTGIFWEHAALKPHYRGWDGSTASHLYNWHDGIPAPTGITPNPNVCDYEEPAPCDMHGHGTHTLGTMVGDDGLGSQIGVAPGAKWIGCRNMDNGGNGTIESYLECFDFFLAPYGADPTDRHPELAPHIINNSWGCTPGEGCTTAMLASLEPAVQSLTSAGILVVGSAGNAGSGCGTIWDPPAIYPDTFTVGAYGEEGFLAAFSSRGPISYGGVTRIGPDLAAPGVNVLSSTRYGTTSYGPMHGTSMASPHVAGAAALLWSARPQLQGQIELTKQILRRTARPTGAGLTGCESNPTEVPNNFWGWGKLDALAAVEEGLTTGTLTATVLLAGEPFPAREVQVHGDYALELTTDEQGQVALPLPSGTYTVTVPINAQDVLTQTVTVTQDGLHSLSFDVPYGTLTTTVTRMGAPMRYIDVQIEGYNEFETATGLDGSATLPLPIDAYTVTVRFDGDATLSQSVVIAQGESESLSFILPPVRRYLPLVRLSPS